MKRITFFILSIFCITSCNNEALIDNPDNSGGRIELRMPDASVVNVYSTATVSECRIDNIWVIEFDATGTMVSDHYQLIDDPSLIVRNGQATQLLPQLDFKPTTGNTIVCIANSDKISGTLPANFSKTDKNTTFPISTKKYYIGGDYLPMYGEMSWTALTGFACTMTRAVAKIQVQMGTSVSDVTTNFTANSVTYEIYNSGSSGHIQPATPTILGTAETASRFTSNNFNLLQSATATESNTNAYLYEYPSSVRTGAGSGIGSNISNADFNVNRQYLLLKKTVSSVNTYYRLDFYNYKDEVFFDTKRNHHYIFTINHIRSEGYSSVTQAQNNPGSNIEYTVYINDGSKHITSNGQYAIVTNVDSIIINTPTSGAYSGITTSLNIRFEDPKGILDPATRGAFYTTAEDIYPVSTTISVDSPTSITNANQDVTVSVSASFVTGYIVFHLGNIKHRVFVRRFT